MFGDIIKSQKLAVKLKLLEFAVVNKLKTKSQFCKEQVYFTSYSRNQEIREEEYQFEVEVVLGNLRCLESNNFVACEPWSINAGA